MNIDKLLTELGVFHECYNNTEFDSLGLIGSKANHRLCSFITDTKYLSEISESITVLLAKKNYSSELNGVGICVVEDPRRTFFLLHNHLVSSDSYTRPKTDTMISKTAIISELASISKKNVVIGENVVIEEFVSIKENVTIGNNCVIRAGTVVGGEGFEQKKNGQEAFTVRHAGGVIIGNNVEIQQNSCVDKAIYPWDNTIIDDHCRIDNLVHIAHAVKLHKRVFVAACACIAGRTIVEDNAWIGPGATIVNGVRIGKNSRVNLGAVATQSVSDNLAVSGNFAIDHNHFIDNLKRIR